MTESEGTFIHHKKDNRGRPPLIDYEEQVNWKDKYGINILSNRAVLFVDNLVEEKLITPDQEYAAYLMYKSCESRINACLYGTRIYKGVHNDYKDAPTFWIDIYHNKPDMWQDWIRLSDEYIKSGVTEDKPSIDRICEDKHIGYRLDNIRAMTLSDNVKRATSKPQYLFNLDKGTFRQFDNRQDALDFLGIKSKSDTGQVVMVDGCRYLIQSSGVSEGRKEFEEKDLDENDWVTVKVPIGRVNFVDGKQGIVYQDFQFAQMSIVLNPNKEVIDTGNIDNS